MYYIFATALFLMGIASSFLLTIHIGEWLIKTIKSEITPSSDKPKETLRIQGLDILYDESKGHVIEGTINGKTMYLRRSTMSRDRATEYYDRCVFNLRHDPSHPEFFWYNDLKHGINVNQRWEDVFDEDHYLKLVEEDKVLQNLRPIYHNLSIRKNWTKFLNQASRYSDDELPMVESGIKYAAKEELKSLPMQELLELSHIDYTEKDKDLYYEVLSYKLEEV